MYHYSPEAVGHQMQQVLHQGIPIGCRVAGNVELQVKVQMAGPLSPDDLQCINDNHTASQPLENLQQCKNAFDAYNLLVRCVAKMHFWGMCKRRGPGMPEGFERKCAAVDRESQSETNVDKDPMS